MTITDKQRTLICSYYEYVVGIGRQEKSVEEMASLLSKKMYETLFKNYPQYEQFFPKEPERMFKLQCMVYEVLRTAIMHLFSITKEGVPKYTAYHKIKEDFSTIGKQHRKIIDRDENKGLDTHHFEAVGKSLLFALKSYGESIWTSEMEEAWIYFYRDLYSIMQKAMRYD